MFSNFLQNQVLFIENGSIWNNSSTSTISISPLPTLSPILINAQNNLTRNGFIIADQPSIVPQDNSTVGIEDVTLLASQASTLLVTSGSAVVKASNQIKSNSTLFEENFDSINSIGIDNTNLLNIEYGMAFAALFFFIAFVLLFLYSLYIALPEEICDRRKLQVIEFLLRLSNEYLADIVETIFGVEIRNRLLRFLTAILFAFLPRPPKWCRVETILIEGISCRFYLPLGEYRKSNALLIHIHGGGWCFMKPKYYDITWFPLIRKTGAPMVSIDYQLSPEVQFKTAILECECVLNAIYNEKFKDYGVDRNRIVVMGDSAGGNLTTVLAQRALRQGKPFIIKHQILIYPVIHMLDLLSSSYRAYYERYKGTGLLNPRMMARWFLMYLGIEATERNQKSVLKNQHISREIRENPEISTLLDQTHLPDCIRTASKLSNEKRSTSYHSPTNEALSDALSKYLMDPDFCPILGKNLENLAPTMIMTAGIDVLRDEGILYKRCLENFNVPVEWKYYPSAFHGVLHMPFSRIRKKMINDIFLYLQKNLIL